MIKIIRKPINLFADRSRDLVPGMIIRDYEYIGYTKIKIDTNVYF